MVRADKTSEGGVEERIVRADDGVLDHLLEGCQVVDSAFRYTYVNDALLRQAKATRNGLLGRTMMECYPGIESTPMFSVLRTCMLRREPQTLENEFEFPDGSRGWFELRFEPVPGGVAILSVDVTARKEATLALQRNMRALKTLSRCNQTLVRATDEQRFIADTCDLLVDAGGYRAASIVVHRPEESRDPGPASTVECSSGRPPPFSEVSLTLDIPGRRSTLGRLTVHAEGIDSVGLEERALLEEIALDIGYGIETLRDRVSHELTQKQLIASRRLEAIGQLAGGIAHDFNNILSVILSYTGFAEKQLSPSDPLRDDIQQAHEAGKRAAALTRQLLAFSRQQVMAPCVTSLGRVISGLERMLTRILSAEVELKVRLSNDLGNVFADPGQLEQVLVNLTVNARDAMDDGGLLSIEADNIDLDEETARARLSLKGGPYVRLSVSDTGAGISEDIQDRIFEPFFTTKDAGRGTGLGLATVYGIIQQSGGSIEVESEPGRGTTFTIYLPRVQSPAAEQNASPVSTPLGGRETVLVVEDDPSVSAATKRILEARGYTVLSAATPEEALLICDDFSDSIDLLLTDVVLPQMRGPELAKRAQEQRPTMKVLYTSGYAGPVVDRFIGEGTAYIIKPFSDVELSGKVRERLDGSS